MCEPDEGQGGRGLVLYKRWRLREGVTAGHVTNLVVHRIVPHYQRLSGSVVLGLEQLDENTMLAIQRWPDRAERDAAMSGAAFDAWWQEYLPILAEWDAALEFEAEWEGDTLI